MTYSRVVGNNIQGNLIGTDISGRNAVPNQGNGIALQGSSQNLVGWDPKIGRNVISGNAGNGIVIAGGAENRIRGNSIGLAAAGTSILGNGLNGVLLTDGAHHNTVGGSYFAFGNIISGNVGSGVAIHGMSSTENDVLNNSLGSNARGTIAVPNGVGITIDDAAANTIGTPESPNIIAHNQGPGVAVTGLASANSIRGNSIHSNGGLGIDLGSDGITPNDKGAPPDADSGPNGLQNYPQLSSVKAGTSTTVVGKLKSTPNQRFLIDVYASPTGDPSGYGEGQRWLGQLEVLTNGDGTGSFNQAVVGSSVAGEFITATATRLDDLTVTPPVARETSEFSAALQIKTKKTGGGGGPAFDAFYLELPGIEGSVQTDGYADWIPVSFDFEMDRMVEIGQTISAPLQLATVIDQTSPQLLDAALTSHLFSEAVLVGVHGGDSGLREFARWTLDNASVGAFATNGVSQDNFTLTFDALSYEYSPDDTVTVSGSWNVMADDFVATARAELPTPSSLPDNVTVLVQVPGIPGDSNLQGYRDWIEVQSLAFDAQQPDPSSGNGPIGIPVQFVTQTGTASARLFQASADGQILLENGQPSNVRIAVIQTLGTSVPGFQATWELENPVVTSFTTQNAGLDGFAIGFDALHYNFTAVDSWGRYEPTTQATWDVIGSAGSLRSETAELPEAAGAIPAYRSMSRFREFPATQLALAIETGSRSTRTPLSCYAGSNPEWTCRSGRHCSWSASPARLRQNYSRRRRTGSRSHNQRSWRRSRRPTKGTWRSLVGSLASRRSVLSPPSTAFWMRSRCGLTRSIIATRRSTTSVFSSLEFPERGTWQTRAARSLRIRRCPPRWLPCHRTSD